MLGGSLYAGKMKIRDSLPYLSKRGVLGKSS